MKRLQCEMSNACRAPVTHLGEKGYVYCTEHAADRRQWERCRKMRSWELRWLRDGKTLPSYRPGPEPKGRVDGLGIFPGIGLGTVVAGAVGYFIGKAGR